MYFAMPAVDFFDLDDWRVRLACARQAVLRHSYADGDNLLSDEERQRHAAIRSRHYANAWRAGRILAKVLISATHYCGPLSPRQITIRSHGDRGSRTRPRLWHGDRQLEIDLSLSHGTDLVLAGLTTAARTRVGVDVVSFGAVTDSLQRMWFLPSERRWGPDDPVASQIWAAKEAVYKALNEGESFYPRRILIEDRDATSCQCRYQSPTGVRRLMVRTWETTDGHLACAVAKTARSVGLAGRRQSSSMLERRT